MLEPGHMFVDTLGNGGRVDKGVGQHSARCLHKDLSINAETIVKSEEDQRRYHPLLIRAFVNFL